MGGFQCNLAQYSPFEWGLLKRFSRSEVKCQGHNQTECYNGGGMHFCDVALRLTCLIPLVS